ncbi:G patch domain-containing protein 1 isoform X1 [Aquarana catesbeiana]|uniref:G patch domain-containing protein 1 isoform X1 n=1 Tax=Aquarana catesbeiana TaxID=8400 RepID=UPI003CCA57FB
MAAQDSDSEEDFVTYGKPLEQYEEGEKPKKPTPLQEQTVKDEKGRFKRFHGAFTGGFSAGYFNTVGTKEGWAPSTFVSSRQGKSESKASRPEDFMDEEDLGEFGIAPNEIMTTDDFASKTKNKIREKARELAAVTAPIPGATILEDLIAPAKITVGVQLLRQMGWKEGQGVGPRTKRKTRKQETESGKKVYGCALPPIGSEGSEDEEDEYLPENVTFAPKDVTPVDFTVKDNVHGLGYRGLDPRQALFGSLDSHVNLFGDGSDRTFSSLGDVRHSKGRKVGISGQAFGVGALEDEDDDIYGTDSMSKYDTVLKEESGDNLFGWTAPKEYRSKKGSTKELQYIGKVLEGFSITTQSSALKKVYPAPELPRDYKPVHYFRPVLSAASQNSATLQALLASSQSPPAEPKKDQLPSRHQLSSSQRREMLGEEALQGPASVLDLLSNKDRERIKDMTQTLEEQRLKAQKLAQEAIKNRFQAASADEAQNKRQDELLDRRLIPPNASEFRPFEGNPEKQKRYEIYTRKLHEGQKDALETSLDSSMTEWEQSREQDEFMRSAMLYKPTNSSLSSRFTRGKHEDDSDNVEVPRDQEGDMDDKSAAVKMKMFGKLTRDQFEWHPDKLLCKRFNIPDPYPGSTLIGLPKVKRDKYSVFNFLTIPEPQPSTTCAAIPEKAPEISDNKPKKSSRWDVSSTEKKKDPLTTFLSQARSQSEEKEEGKEKRAPPPVSAATSSQSQVDQDAEEEEEETRPPIDLFKAIFADSSEKSSSEEESDEEDSSLPREEIEDIRPETAPPSIVREPKLEVHQPIPPTVTDGPDKMNAEEEFGPRLPPALPSATPRITCDSPSLSRDDSLKKSKQKRHKEKHRLKKEHKHKKEKKKKHKKQKHKSKHKNKKENNDSTDSEESSVDLSDTEEAAKITPRELLKRLKNLPIPH